MDDWSDPKTDLMKDINEACERIREKNNGRLEPPIFIPIPDFEEVAIDLRDNYIRPECETDPEYIDWVNSRPKPVQEMLAKFPPYQLYKIGNTGYPATLHAIDENEDGTITLKMKVHDPMFPRIVFDIHAENVKLWEFKE